MPEKIVAVFTTELQIMVDSALPILESLDNLSRQQQHAVFQSVLMQISKLVREGNSLSFAFSRYPQIFDQVYISPVSYTHLRAHET